MVAWNGCTSEMKSICYQMYSKTKLRETPTKIFDTDIFNAFRRYQLARRN